jgi:hypothetical protein
VILALPGAGPRDRQRQYNRNPARCQLTTVSGFTIRSTSAQRDQTLRNAVQNNRSIRLSLGRGRLRFRTATCWRKARISRARSVRPIKKTLTAVAKSRMNRSMNLPLYHRAKSLIPWLGRVLATNTLKCTGTVARPLTVSNAYSLLVRPRALELRSPVRTEDFV